MARSSPRSQHNPKALAAELSEELSEELIEWAIFLLLCVFGKGQHTSFALHGVRCKYKQTYNTSTSTSMIHT
jgi:hypothetical protein